MKNLMTTNCYDVKDPMIIIGTCLPDMQPKAYEELLAISNNVYSLCLEDTHLNMAITKISGMLCRVKINKLIFATVDKSPHCIQMHYIENELTKMMDLSNVEIVHYVAVNDKLVEVSKNKIKQSKCLSE